MKIKCKICGNEWNCLRDSCYIRDTMKDTCEKCINCFLKEVKIAVPTATIESVSEINSQCYPKEFNPSRRK